jgi:hypothetical protein
MDRSVAILNDGASDIEVHGLGVFPPGEHNFEATDEQIHVWEAVNDQEWPEQGLIVGYELDQQDVHLVGDGHVEMWPQPVETNDTPTNNEDED